MLRKRHRTRIKPAVNNLRNPVHLFSTIRTFECNLINIRSVQLYLRRIRIPAPVRKFLPAADTFLMTALALPHIERRAPVTVSRNTPVLNILKPVAKTTFSDRFRNPVYSIVIPYQVILHSRHLDKPRLARIVNQRRIAAPAVRIIMLKLRRVKQQSLALQILQNHRVRLLHKHTRIRGFFRHLTLAVYKLYKRKVIFSADICIILTKRRRNMNDTSTVRHRNIIVACDIMCIFPLLFNNACRKVKQRLICFSL